ncbi:hypothetical protein [Bartonella sp. MM73XJBT]|nr:hypothetical protein [Bartonella sp. MM73XJBT]
MRLVEFLTSARGANRAELMLVKLETTSGGHAGVEQLMQSLLQEANAQR